MVNPVVRSHIQDAVIEDISCKIPSAIDRSRFCGLIMKGLSIRESEQVLENFSEDREPHYFELREMGFCHENAITTVRATPWTLQDHQVRDKIVEVFLEDLKTDLATESQMERFYSLIRSGHKLEEAFGAAMELTEE